MLGQLLILTGPDQGRALPLLADRPLLLGRGRQTDSHLTDLHVSRVHCQVEVRGPRVVLTDLNSNGGTYVNGQRVTEATLRPGDVITLGATQIRLQAVDVADMQTLPPEQGLPPPPAVTLPPVAPSPPPPPPAAATIPVTSVPRSPAESPREQPRARPARESGLPGERLAELAGSTLSHFKIGALLGKGRTGMVFRARDLKSGRGLALKVMKPEFARSEHDVRRFVRSMKTMLPLRHPNLVTVYSAGKKGPYCWVAMEFVEGESLTQVIRRVGVAGMLDWRIAYWVAVHIARALEYAHGHKIIHRNLTPQNILIRARDRVAKLGDLMLAKALEGQFAENITRSDEILGDLRYMSPERTRGIDQIDARSDLYSLGALVYALLTGQPPFEGLTLADTVEKIRKARPELPKKYQMSIPDAFQGLVLQMLAKLPESRYQTASQVLKDLDRIGHFLGLIV